MADEDYAKIVEVAKSWANDQTLPASKRETAETLAELAEILTDPQYGCPSEAKALRLIGCRLCEGLGADVCHHPDDGVCPSVCPGVCPLGLQTTSPLPD